MDDYYAALFTWDPNQATYAGIHDYDNKLADLSAENFTRRSASLKKFHEQLKTLRAGRAQRPTKPSTPKRSTTRSRPNSSNSTPCETGNATRSTTSASRPRVSTCS